MTCSAAYGRRAAVSTVGVEAAALFEAVPNFSEGRRPAVIAELADDPHVIDVHADPDHNRAVVTMAAADPGRLATALLARVGVAVARIDLSAHAGVHPRVGAADVVPIVPLGQASMDDAIGLARILAERIWAELGVPVYLYGEAAGGRRLSEIRAGRVEPDLGRDRHPTAGAVCVGARRPLVAFNIVFPTLATTEVRALAARMRAMPGVQALAFRLAGGRPQLSLNLTDLAAVAVPRAYTHACRLAGQAGEPELVGLCPAAAAGPGCGGGLLEARLAASAARQAAVAAARRAGDQPGGLARRLAGESRSLGRLAADQESVLAGAERVVALTQLLAAADLGSPELEALLGVAARGLRAAVGSDTAARFARRVALLDEPRSR